MRVVFLCLNFVVSKNEGFRLYLLVEDDEVRDHIYNSKIDSVNFLIKDSIFRGKPQELMLDGYFTSDFIMPCEIPANKVRIDTINGKPMFVVCFIKTRRMEHIKSGLLESTKLQ